MCAIIFGESPHLPDGSERIILRRHFIRCPENVVLDERIGLPGVGTEGVVLAIEDRKTE
jgi:hypothetical protein